MCLLQKEINSMDNLYQCLSITHTFNRTFSTIHTTTKCTLILYLYHYSISCNAKQQVRGGLPMELMNLNLQDPSLAQTPVTTGNGQESQHVLDGGKKPGCHF